MTDNNVVTPTIDELRNTVNNFKSNPNWFQSELDCHDLL
jgi:hypothetical protein